MVSSAPVLVFIAGPRHTFWNLRRPPPNLNRLEKLQLLHVPIISCSMYSGLLYLWTIYFSNLDFMRFRT